MSISDAEVVTLNALISWGVSDMQSFVKINGAKIEKTFFDANVKEAKGYDWSLQKLPPSLKHAHCIICNITIEQGVTARKSRGGWLCDYCYDHFLSEEVEGRSVSLDS